MSFAGVHAYAEPHRVAALGTTAAHPAYRGWGHGTTVAARLRNELLSTIDVIGLNAGAENTATVRCHERVGFAAAPTTTRSSPLRDESGMPGFAAVA